MIQNRINYEKNKRKSIRELCENVLDVAIELKPMRMRANVVEHAVLKEKVDIDVALKEYDDFLSYKERQKTREKEIQAEKEAYFKRKKQEEEEAAR
jgi:hypothetical protein